MNTSGCAMPRWQVPQVTGSAVLRSSNCARYLVLRSSVILIIKRAVSLTGFASEGKSLRLVSGFRAWQNSHSTPRSPSYWCISLMTWSPVMSLGRTLILVGLGRGPLGRSGRAVCAAGGVTGASWANVKGTGRETTHTTMREHRWIRFILAKYLFYEDVECTKSNTAALRVDL